MTGSSPYQLPNYHIVHEMKLVLKLPGDINTLLLSVHVTSGTAAASWFLDALKSAKPQRVVDIVPAGYITSAYWVMLKYQASTKQFIAHTPTFDSTDTKIIYATKRITMNRSTCVTLYKNNSNQFRIRFFQINGSLSSLVWHSSATVLTTQT